MQKANARLSDLICIEHQLSTITNPQHRNTSYTKWEGYTPYLSHRDLLRNDIDEVISMMPNDFDKFLELMKERDYEIKVGKHIAFKKKEQKKFIRLRSLGEGYSEDEIRLSISERKVRNPKSNQKQTDKTSLLIDVQKKLDEGKGQGYANWAKVFNLKQMAKTVLYLQENKFADYDEFSKRVDEITAEFNELREEIRKYETRIEELAEFREQVINYLNTREIFAEYKASGYSKKFLAEHESEIILHRAAKSKFNELDIKKLPSVKLINKEYAELKAKKKKAYSKYYSLKDKQKEMLIHKSNVENIFNMSSKDLGVTLGSPFTNKIYD